MSFLIPYIPAIVSALSGMGAMAASGSKGMADKSYLKAVPTMTKEQQGLINQILGGASQNLPSGFNYLRQILDDDPEMMKQFEAPMMRQFREGIVPEIAQRFAGMGSGPMGSLGSSGFQQELGSSATDLSERLGAQRANLKSGALSHLGSFVDRGLTPQFDYKQTTKPGMGGSLGEIGKLLMTMTPELMKFAIKG